MALEKRKLLAILAHPDDETFGTGGTLAYYATLGMDVALLCATRGEAGEISKPDLATRQSLPQVREKEMIQACEALGVSEWQVLGYRDSGMVGTQDNEHPDALIQADPNEVVGRLVEYIRCWRPDVIITFDERGGYGHPDHIAIHKYATQAFYCAGDAEQYPEQLAHGRIIHSPQRLYYTVFPRSLVERLEPYFSAMDPPSDNPIETASFGVEDRMVTTVLDVSTVLARVKQAILAHRTQLAQDNPFQFLPPDLVTAWLSRQYFIRAAPPLGRSRVESGLFS